MPDPWSFTEADLKRTPRCWRDYELREGGSVTGVVVRMPRRDAYMGSRLFLAAGEEVIAIAATEKSGHAVLARDLGRKNVKLGQRITIRHNGVRLTQDGKRRYRLEQVVV